MVVTLTTLASLQMIVAGDISSDVLSAHNMVLIPPGTFLMGSPTNEVQWDASIQQRAVTLTSAFYMGKYEVTQCEYESVVGNNPSHFVFDPHFPVDQVTWYEATNYCYLLTQQELAAGRIPSGWSYRLPTEAEWEYACRAGTTTAFYLGNAIHRGDADFVDNIEYDSTIGDIYTQYPPRWPIYRTVIGGNYPPNPWGLYDMYGNVQEWCLDWLNFYDSTPAIDPVCDVVNPLYHLKVLRGGGFSSPGAGCRSAYKNNNNPGNRVYNIGFRIVLAPVESAWKTVITTETGRQTFPDIPSRPSGVDSLIFITHGRIPSGDNPDASMAWVDMMSNSVSAYLTAHHMTNWQVLGYKWIEGAQRFVPDTVLNNARQFGAVVGKHIVSEGYTHVHFIAHSAGAGLIQSATDTIRSSPSSSSVIIHETFLDPYVGILGSGVSEYGQGTDWADNYFARDWETETFGNLFPFTDSVMLHTYNVDVTSLDTIDRVKLDYFITGEGIPCYKTVSKHMWPVNFYSNTIAGIVSSDYDGFGFLLSEVGGSWCATTNTYKAGNGMGGNGTALKTLGVVDPRCFLPLYPPTYPKVVVDFMNSPSQFAGDIQAIAHDSIKLSTHSPAWQATFVTLTNPVNVVSFDMEFQSVPDAQGLLSVYWDDHMIGSIDERAVQAGLQHYTYTFPLTSSNSLHMFGFRIDPFTNIQSVAVLTNVVLSCKGVIQPFTLSATTNTSNGLRLYQLNAQAGFEYIVQASADLINWTNIAILDNTGDATRFFDKDSLKNDYRFYRALAPY